MSNLKDLNAWERLVKCASLLGKTITKKDDPNSFLRAMSADAGTQDGINPHIAVFDELHRQRNSDLWDVLKYGMATRSQPLLFAITTAGITGESPICEQQHGYARATKEGLFQDPSCYLVIFGLDGRGRSGEVRDEKGIGSDGQKEVHMQGRYDSRRDRLVQGESVSRPSPAD